MELVWLRYALMLHLFAATAWRPGQWLFFDFAAAPLAIPYVKATLGSPRSIPTCAGEPLHKLICGLGLYSPTECLCLAIFFFETVNPLYGAVILTPERPTHKEACGKAVGRLCLLRLRILVPRAGAGIPRSCEQLGARPSYSKLTEYPKAMM